MPDIEQCNNDRDRTNRGAAVVLIVVLFIIIFVAWTIYGKRSDDDSFMLGGGPVDALISKFANRYDLDKFRALLKFFIKYNGFNKQWILMILNKQMEKIDHILDDANAYLKKCKNPADKQKLTDDCVFYVQQWKDFKTLRQAIIKSDPRLRDAIYANFNVFALPPNYETYQYDRKAKSNELLEICKESINYIKWHKVSTPKAVNGYIKKLDDIRYLLNTILSYNENTDECNWLIRQVDNLRSEYEKYKTKQQYGSICDEKLEGHIAVVHNMINYVKQDCDGVIYDMYNTNDVLTYEINRIMTEYMDFMSNANVVMAYKSEYRDETIKQAFIISCKMRDVINRASLRVAEWNVSNYQTDVLESLREALKTIKTNWHETIKLMIKNNIKEIDFEKQKNVLTLTKSNIEYYHNQFARDFIDTINAYDELSVADPDHKKNIYEILSKYAKYLKESFDEKIESIGDAELNNIKRDPRLEELLSIDYIVDDWNQRNPAAGANGVNDNVNQQVNDVNQNDNNDDIDDILFNDTDDIPPNNGNANRPVNDVNQNGEANQQVNPDNGANGANN